MHISVRLLLHLIPPQYDSNKFLAHLLNEEMLVHLVWMDCLAVKECRVPKVTILQ